MFRLTKAGLSQNIIYFLPKNTNLRQLASLAEPGPPILDQSLTYLPKVSVNCEIEENYLDDRFKSLTVYYGVMLASKENAVGLIDEEGYVFEVFPKDLGVE